MSYGRCNIELHHTLGYFMALFDIFSGDNEGCLHFFHGFASMTFIDATVIGCDNKNSLIKHSGFFYSIDYLAYILIQFFQHYIIFRSVMTCCMSDMVRVVDDYGQQVRMCFFYIISSILCSSCWVTLCFGNMFIIIECESIYQTTDCLPFVYATYLSFGIGFMQ